MLGVLFRETCPSCGGVSGAGFCSVCAADLPRTSNPCAGCGLARPVARCPRQAAPWQVDAVVAPFAYAPPLDHHIQQLKYAGARSLGRAFGLTLAPAVRDACSDVDVLVAVPLHPTRLRERGYNQAIEIARSLSRALDLPLLLRGIERRHASPSQTGGSAVQRRASVAAAFRVARSRRRSSHRDRRRRDHDGRHRQRAGRGATRRRRGALHRRSPPRARRKRRVSRGTGSRARCRRTRRRPPTRCSGTRGSTGRRRGP